MQPTRVAQRIAEIAKGLFRSLGHYDLVERFRDATPNDLQYIIEDLFESITFYDNRAVSASYLAQDDGTFTIRLRVQAKKLRADATGTEKEVPVNDMIDIGIQDS